MKKLYINFLFVAFFLCSCSALEIQRSEYDVLTSQGVLHCIYERNTNFNCSFDKENKKWQDMEDGEQIALAIKDVKLR